MWPGRMSRDLGRDAPDSENTYARNLWADFSFPKNVTKKVTEASEKVRERGNSDLVIVL